MRSIEEMQASIKDIQSELQQLREDLDDLRSEKNGGALNFDIDEVAVKAKHDPVSPHPLSGKDEYTRRRYLILLLSVAQFEQDKLRDSLLLAHRIAYGCGYLTDGNLLDEYTASHSLTFAQLDELVALFANDDLRLMLIEEMLLMAGQFDKGLKPAVDYISQVCQLLNITSEEITFLSQMSTVILTGDMSLYTCDIVNNYTIFDCYLKHLDLAKYRKLLTLNIPSEIKVKMPNYQLLKNGNEMKFKGAGLKKNGDSLTICAKYTGGDYMKLHCKNYLGSPIKHTIVTKKIDKFFVLFANHLEKDQGTKPVGITVHPLDTIDVESYYKSNGGVIDMIANDDDDFDTSKDVAYEIL